MRIAVFNTFDITPAENGGEIRLLNLYGRISHTDSVRFLSYDLRCKQAIRRERVATALDIVDTMVTEKDRWTFFQANERLGLYPHDLLCIDTYDFSGPFLREIGRALDWAEVVIVTHPYLATTILPRCAPGQLRVFEALNVELHIKSRFLAPAKDKAFADDLLAAVRRSEAYALEQADIVVTVSDNDSRDLVAEYGVEKSKLFVIPNGVAVVGYDAISREMCEAFRREMGLGDTDVGVFLGSAYGPNVDSYRKTRDWLDEAGFTGTIFVIGRISDVYDDSWPTVKFKEEWVGFVDDATKHLLVRAADFALQIVLSGGGTNLKLFDYMASGTPILANEFGRRGVVDEDWYISVDDAAGMREIVKDRRWHHPDAARAAATARDIALRDFDWDSIATRYRAVLA